MHMQLPETHSWHWQTFWRQAAWLYAIQQRDTMLGTGCIVLISRLQANVQVHTCGTGFSHSIIDMLQGGAKCKTECFCACLCDRFYLETICNASKGTKKLTDSDIARSWGGLLARELWVGKRGLDMAGAVDVHEHVNKEVAITSTYFRIWLVI